MKTNEAIDEVVNESGAGKLAVLLDSDPDARVQFAELVGRLMVKLGVRYALPACGATFVLGMLIGYLIHH